jgi:hypothetical protein
MCVIAKELMKSEHAELLDARHISILQFKGDERKLALQILPSIRSQYVIRVYFAVRVVLYLTDKTKHAFYDLFDCKISANYHGHIFLMPSLD